MPLFGVTEINVNGLHVLKIIHTNSRFERAQPII
jgi:hypothetical protein